MIANQHTTDTETGATLCKHMMGHWEGILSDQFHCDACGDTIKITQQEFKLRIKNKQEIKDAKPNRSKR